MPKSVPAITQYAEYLKLDDLLALQHTLSDSPDELHFIVVHQIHELWFKMAILHLSRAAKAMDGDQPIEAARLIGQVSECFEVLRATAHHLHSLPPAAFQRFRGLLSPASGMQSFQFREIELIAGRRDPEFLSWVRATFPRPQDWERAEKQLGQPPLTERFAALTARAGIPDLTALYAQPQQWPQVYALAEALSAFDHAVGAWRQVHIQLVERTIGAGTVGTGGTTHDYLQRTSHVHFFPALWEARNELTRRSAAQG